eukprot:gene51360-62804_t
MPVLFIQKDSGIILIIIGMKELSVQKVYSGLLHDQKMHSIGDKLVVLYEQIQQ